MRVCVLLAILSAVASCGSEGDDVGLQLQSGTYEGLGRYEVDTCQIYPVGHTELLSVVWMNGGAVGYDCWPDGANYVCERYDAPVGECAVSSQSTVTIEPTSETSFVAENVLHLTSVRCAVDCRITMSIEMEVE